MYSFVVDHVQEGSDDDHQLFPVSAAQREPPRVRLHRDAVVLFRWLRWNDGVATFKRSVEPTDMRSKRSDLRESIDRMATITPTGKRSIPAPRVGAKRTNLREPVDRMLGRGTVE